MFDAIFKTLVSFIILKWFYFKREIQLDEEFQSAGINQVLEKICDTRRVCSFVVRPKILSSLIWMKSPISMRAVVIVKKDCMLAIIPFSIPQSVLRRSRQILFSSNAFRKKWAEMIGSLLLRQARSQKTFLENSSIYPCTKNP